LTTYATYHNASEKYVRYGERRITEANRHFIECEREQRPYVTVWPKSTRSIVEWDNIALDQERRRKIDAALPELEAIVNRHHVNGWTACGSCYGRLKVRKEAAESVASALYDVMAQAVQR